jgi:hypothetical protein
MNKIRYNNQIKRKKNEITLYANLKIKIIKKNFSPFY